ncbi:MAG: efflux RND transporter periplasmic adaptor subunit [Polyangiaceae bacterium]|nr:efflux RND transporter periplasmic adaptor subunit [Polyangiaceae bacterium]
MSSDETTPKAPDGPSAPEPVPHAEHFEEGDEAPPRGVRVAAAVRWLLLLAMAAVAVLTIYRYAQGQNADEPKYYCPMHPKITSPLPGECPICHMNLEPIPADRKGAPGTSAPSAQPTPPPAGTGGPGPAPSGGSSAAPASAEPQDGARYSCPMHPEVRSRDPGRCPKCGMFLEPIKPMGAPLPDGTMPVTLTLDQIQAIGVRTALVEKRPREQSQRFVATVEVPDEGRAEVHVRTEGFIEAIRVKELGVKVKAGDLLASYYSPEIYQAAQELIAMKAFPTGGDYAPPTDAAYRRLELLGVGRGTAERMAATGVAQRDIGISAPIAGHVIKKGIVLGSRVMPDTVLFEIADLTKVYVVASVYAEKLTSIHVGDVARFVKNGLPDRVFEAKVDLIYQDVDVVTRTTRVRFKVDNKDLALRPGDFGTAELDARSLGDVLTVPLDAVIDTGREAYVFIVLGEGRFEPRRVAVWAELDGRLVIRDGVQEGERVVSGATFLIDSESRLQAAFAGGASTPAAGAQVCDADFDRTKYPDKWQRCVDCQPHRSMGRMYEDCLEQIPRPWK